MEELKTEMTHKKCIFSVDDRIFCAEAVLKASYMFLDKYYVSAEYRAEHSIIVTIEPKSTESMADIDKKFTNELISQMVRYDLLKSNKAMKELILGRALFSTCLDTNEPEVYSQDDNIGEYSIDDIAVDWFETHDKTDNTIKSAK